MNDIKFIIVLMLLIIGPISIKLYSDKNKKGWNGIKSFRILGPYLALVFFLLHVWVYENYDNLEMWLVFFVILFLGLVAQYGISLMSESRLRNKKKE